MEVEKEEGDHGYPEVKLTGKRKDIEKVLADIWGPDIVSDYEDYFESVVTEGKESDEAEAILNDLLDERVGDMGELHGMEMEDALDTVEAYGHKGSKAKKIAQELVSMTNESAVTEAEIKSDEEFTEYANTVLKQAFGEEFDEAKAKKVIDGILAKADGDYGTAAGMLTSSLGA